MNASKLLDALLGRFKFKNDAALSRASGLSPAVISKLRNGSMGLSPGCILSIHEHLGVPVKEIREMAA